MTSSKATFAMASALAITDAVIAAPTAAVIAGSPFVSASMGAADCTGAGGASSVAGPLSPLSVARKVLAGAGPRKPPGGRIANIGLYEMKPQAALKGLLEYWTRGLELDALSKPVPKRDPG